MIDAIMLLGGGVLLYFGAEWLVGGAAGLARSLRVPALIVGLTVVAYGTSAPEIVVGIQAALDAHPDLALGNVIGSNIANLGLILGVSALVTPAVIDGALARRELWVLGASTLALPLVLLDGAVAMWEGALMLAAAIGYTAWMVVATRKSPRLVAEAHRRLEAKTARGSRCSRWSASRCSSSVDTCSCAARPGSRSRSA
jgi:cation:H+ antiporter